VVAAHPVRAADVRRLEPEIGAVILRAEERASVWRVTAGADRESVAGDGVVAVRAEPRVERVDVREGIAEREEHVRERRDRRVGGRVLRARGTNGERHEGGGGGDGMAVAHRVNVLRISRGGTHHESGGWFVVFGWWSKVHRCPSLEQVPRNQPPP